MAAILQLRRGISNASASVLSEGELYLHQGTGSIQFGSGSNTYTLLPLNTPINGDINLVGNISASSLNLTGNATVAGNISFGGGLITLGDDATDNIVIVADLNSSIIPNNNNTFDLGASDKKWKNLYATSISGAIAATNGVISGSSQITSILDSLNTFSGSQLTQNIALATISGSLISSASTAKTTNDSQDVSITNLNTNSASVNISVAALNLKTGSYATTGSNIFIGNQTITGSLTISGSSTFRNIGPTILSGSVLVSGSINSDGIALDATATTNIPALNTSFNSDFSSSASTFINKSLVLGDGKVLVAGRFESVDGHTTNDIARFNSNGTIDTSFSSPVFSTTIGGDTGGLINTFVTQSDGKVIVGGTFTKVSGAARAGLARLDVNGTLDATFATQSFSSFGEVRDIAIQNDNKIIVVGNFDGGIKRLQTDGTMDTSLSVPDSTGFTNDTFYSVALLPSGSGEAILVGGNFTQWNTLSNYDYIVKLDPSGSLDTGFAGTNLNISTGGGLDRIKKIKVTDAYSEGDNGYIYIAGRFKDTLTGPNVRNAGFARLTTADEGAGRGAFDSGFRTYISGSDQNLSGVTVYVNDFDFYDSNKILLGGNFITFGIPGYSTTSANRFAIIDQDNGSLISGWFASGSASTYNLNTGSVNSVTLIPSTTNVLVGGTFTSASYPSTAREGLASLKLAGLGNVTTTSEYTITANINELLISSSNTYFTGNITASVISASFVGNGSGLTGVTAGNIEFANILNKPTLISGSSQLSGTTITNLTITNLTTVNETASVIFSSGSNRFGDFSDDIHDFTGSVKISGSITTIGVSTATSFNGAINANNGVVSGSSQTIANLPTGTISSSAQTIANLPTGVVSGSSQVTYSDISSISVGIVSGSAQVTPLLPTGVVSASIQIVYSNVSSIPAGIVSGSSQIPSLLPMGVVSGSQQLTGSYDGRYAPSASFATLLGANTLASLGSAAFYHVSSSIADGNPNTLGNAFAIKQYVDDTLTAVGAGDITGVYSGNGLSGSADSGSATLTLNTGSAHFTNGVDARLTPLTSLNSYTSSQDTKNSTLASYTASIDSHILNLNTATSSYETKGRGIVSGSSQITSSFDLRYLVTGSVTSSIIQLNSFTSSINSKTGSYATTGSNSFNGSQQITGSLVVSQNITGSASASFVSLAVNTTTPTQKIHLKGIVGIEAGTTGGDTADQIIFGYNGSGLTQYNHKIQTGHDAQSALNRMDFLLANSSTTWKTPLQLRPDVINVSGSLIVTGSINGTINATNGVISGSSQINLLLPSGIVSGSSQLSGTTITDLTIVNLTTINETASVIFSSGSNRFGDFSNDTHSFTGSVQISGSLTTIGDVTATSFNGVINATNGVISGSSQLTATLPSGVVSGSSQITYASISSIPAGIISSSAQVDADSITNFDSNVKAKLDAEGVISGSSQVSKTLQEVTTAGASTSNAITISNATASTTKTTGALIVTGGIGVSGDINAGGDIVAFASSDIRLKNNIRPIQSPLEKISKISGCEFDWNADLQTIYSGKDYGVIAQEIEEVFPELVQTRENGYKAVKYDKLVSVLIEGIKELTKQVEYLKTKIEN